jgi:hypothetical protein
VVPFDNHDIGFFPWIFDTPLNLMRNGSAAESLQMIDSTQDSIARSSGIAKRTDHGKLLPFMTQTSPPKVLRAKLPSAV